MIDSIVEVIAIKVFKGDQVPDSFIPDGCVNEDGIATEDFIAFDFLPIGTWTGCEYNCCFEMFIAEGDVEFIPFNKLIVYTALLLNDQDEVRFITAWSSEIFDDDVECNLLGVLDLETLEIEEL